MDGEVKHGLDGSMRDLQNNAMTNTKKKRTPGLTLVVASDISLGETMRVMRTL